MIAVGCPCLVTNFSSFSGNSLELVHVGSSTQWLTKESDLIYNGHIAALAVVLNKQDQIFDVLELDEFQGLQRILFEVQSLDWCGVESCVEVESGRIVGKNLDLLWCLALWTANLK